MSFASVAIGVGSVVGGAIAANGAKSAAAQQGQSAQFANNFQMGTYLQSQREAAPYLNAGSDATAAIEDNLRTGALGGNFTAQDYLNNQDPGYAWQLNQGQQALQNSQAAGSGVLSGAALKGLIGYNQGMASTGYQNAYQRWLSQQQNRFGMLNNLASLGENAAVGTGNSGVGYANGAANAAMAQGNAAAAGTVGSANAINGAISNGTGYYMLNSMINKNNNSYDTGFNGQNNPANQAGLDNLVNGLTG